MKAVELAIGFVFLSNAIFLVAAGYVLSRMLRHTRDAHLALTRAAQRTDEAGKSLRDAVYRSASLMSAPPPQAATAPREVPSTGELERLQHQARDLVHRLAKLLKQGAGAASTSTADRSRIGELEAQVREATTRAEKAQTGAEARIAEAQREADRLVTQNTHLRQRVHQLRDELDDAVGTWSQVRAGEGADPLGAVQQEALIGQLQQQLDALRQRLREVTEAGDDTPFDDQATAPPAARGADQAADRLDDLHDMMSSLERENRQLRREVGELKDMMSRTLREKDFIEDRFLVLDRALEAAGASPSMFADIAPA